VTVLLPEPDVPVVATFDAVALPSTESNSKLCNDATLSADRGPPAAAAGAPLRMLPTNLSNDAPKLATDD
jgi:hypothetical protein